MNFRTWHLLMRGGFIVCISALLATYLLPDGRLLQAVKAAGVTAIAVVVVAGALFAIVRALRGKLRLACPACNRKDTRILVYSASTHALLCEHCGIFRECGPFKLKLKREPYTDEHGNPL